MKSQALRIAVLGAESTGKTTLSQALASALQAGARAHGQVRCAWVPELLRQWCDERGRTPRQHEQWAIAQAQQRRIEEAAAAHEIVVCDTTPLMTAIYSQLVFGDGSLLPQAVAWQREMHLSLLTALDLPWVADGLQRDGPQVQRPVDGLLRQAMQAHALPFVVVGGQGPQRLSQALAALSASSPILRELITRLPPTAASTTTTLTSTAPAEPAAPMPPPLWRCECCGEAAYERALRRLQRVSATPTIP